MSEQEFIEAYERFADSIFRHVFFRVFDRELAKDLTQQTFLKSWEYIVSGRKIENVKNFFYQVASNLVTDHFRKKGTLSLDELKEQGFDPGFDESYAAQLKLDTEAMLAGLKQIDEEAKNMLVMRYIDDLGPKEISQILGVSENTVSVRLFRAVNKLRKLRPPYE